MLTMILGNTGGALAIATYLALATHRIRETTANALWAIANFLVGVSFVRADHPLLACWCAAVSAWCAYDWWTKGGGDGIRRRLKTWARRFQGVRRTAPSHA